MKIRTVIENDIVEDISIYKSIYNEYINFIKDEIKHDYKPSFNFDEFCVLMLDNFEGVDGDMREFFEYRVDNTLTNRLMNSILIIAKNEFKNDKKSIEIIENYIKNGV